MSGKIARPRRDEFRRFTQMPTRWGDHDSYGHVNNVVYYSYCESAITAFLVEQGTLDIASSPVIGLIVNSSCTYFSPIVFPDQISVGMKISHLGNSSARYELALFCNDEHEAAAAAHIVYVYVDRASNTSVPIPESVRTVLARLAD
ncbi:thioesterase family protein [Pseudomonas sp. R5(2019)]|uniref:acyl-CoA thioesterase n=1 Tax=Pseudomonas sp. R5(2019) TaxID=2697566 RepID=UPI001411E273|nr:thioesterase family protein [Pseudomonas sp. R5(2019)]NBA96879.1 acyl-CoA thioesterase [Pseudomonas sp. R5(2019)]